MEILDIMQLEIFILRKWNDTMEMEGYQGKWILISGRWNEISWKWNMDIMKMEFRYHGNRMEISWKY